MVQDCKGSDEERPIDLSSTEYATTMPIAVRVESSQQNACLLQLSMSCSDTVGDLIEEVAEFTTDNKYKLVIVKDGKQMKPADSLAENNCTEVLCMESEGGTGPKTFYRFQQMDSIERQMTYISEDEGCDAITFIPLKEISFVGFSVYSVQSSKDDFTCLWSIRIGETQMPQQQTELSHDTDVDPKTLMSDIMLDEPIKVRANTPISIAVRFTVRD